MKSKELTQAIEEGINKSYPVILLKILIITAFILSLIYIGFFVYDTYFYEDCLETGECSMAYNSNCQEVGLDDLHCFIEFSNGTEEYQDYYFNVCGYQEALAFYELSKNEIEPYGNFKIKRVMCE